MNPYCPAGRETSRPRTGRKIKRAGKSRDDSTKEGESLEANYAAGKNSLTRETL